MKLKLTYLLLVDRSIQQYGYPVHFIHVIPGEDPILPDQHVPEKQIVDLKIDHIDRLVSWKAQL